MRGPGVAVVGCGGWGRNLARCFAELDALAAVVDHHAGAADAVAARHSCPALTLEAALADPRVEAVVIATQPRHHHAVGMAALVAGRHLFVEKPLALDLGEAAALVAAARAADRVLMVGHVLRYHPGFIALADLVRKGALGRIVRVEARRMNFGRVRRDEDALWCLAPHDVSMALALLGEAPRSVSALGAYPLGRPIADEAVVSLGFASASAILEVSWLHPIKEQRLTVIGTEGAAVFDDVAPWDGKLVRYRHLVRPGLEPEIERGEAAPIALAPEEPLLAECRHFLDSVRHGHAPRTGPEEALAVMEVLVRAEQAMDAAVPGGRVHD